MLIKYKRGVTSLMLLTGPGNGCWRVQIMETKCVSDFEFKMLVTILVTYPTSLNLQHED